MSLAELQVPVDRGGSAGVALRGVAVGLAVMVCYHRSLWTLLRGVVVDTPLAYLGLVPVVAIVLGWYLARPRPGEPDIHDRTLDHIVGVPLVLSAVAALILLPPHLDTMFWVWRIDLLTMPLFVAGAVAIAFGSRVLWRTKAALLVLLLAWPIPFRALVTRVLDPLSQLTSAVVGLALHAVPVATPTPLDGSTFRIHHATPFVVTIASACSGANGMVGFLLLGSAVALVAEGPRNRKLAWLAAGTLLTWALNVLRILAIVVAGRFLGEGVAIDVLHPWVGLVTFNVAVLAMIATMGRFGLSVPFGRPATAGGGERSAAVRAAAPHARHGVALLVVLAVVGGVVDHDLQRYDPVASAVGVPTLLPFRVAARDLGTERAQVKARYEHGRRFFGESSTWVRYAYRSVAPPLRSNVPVLADVVTTDDLQRFSDFGIEACYRFHGFDMGGVRDIDLGHGITGHLLRWTDGGTGLRWLSLYWIWPVSDGPSQRFERVMLMLNLDPNLRVVPPELPPSVAEQLVSQHGPRLSRRDRQADELLAGMALDVVDTAVEVSHRAGGGTGAG